MSRSSLYERRHKKLIEECESEIQKAENDPEQEKLQETKVHFLGKNGKLTSILRTMKDIPASERPQVGQLINQARERLETDSNRLKTDLRRINWTSS